VWHEGLTGKGFVIRVNDPDGVDVKHPKLAASFNKNASCTTCLPRDKNASHGTAVESTISLLISLQTSCLRGAMPFGYPSSDYRW
jgi:hypothetical protein